jgi:hypothetical protein
MNQTGHRSVQMVRRTFGTGVCSGRTTREVGAVEALNLSGDLKPTWVDDVGENPHQATLTGWEVWDGPDAGIRLMPIANSNVCDFRGGDRNSIVQSLEHQAHLASNVALSEPVRTAL